jgi:hypothetical protein
MMNPRLVGRIAVAQGSHCGGTDNLEAETEHDEDGDPAEPSLSSLSDHEYADQTKWAAGGCSDRELDGAESSFGD